MTASSVGCVSGGSVSLISVENLTPGAEPMPDEGMLPNCSEKFVAGWKGRVQPQPIPARESCELLTFIVSLYVSEGMAGVALPFWRFWC